MAPVPSGWTEHEDASGLYYHNTDSEETRWPPSSHKPSHGEQS
jgi:hypothetical protein